MNAVVETIAAPAAEPAPGTRNAAVAAHARLHHIDALRAIAALLVLWLHVAESYRNLSPQTAASMWVYDSAWSINVGRLGVALFFAISGFVIPFSIRPQAPAPVRDFLLRRAFRIFPLYWLSIPLGIVACHLIWGGRFTFADLLFNLFLLQYAFDHPPAIGLYWTLVVELLFYLACAGLLLVHSIDRYGRIALIAGALIGLHFLSVVLQGMGRFTTFPYLISLWFFHLGIMFWGSLFRAWWEGRLEQPFARAAMWILLGGMTIAYPLYCAFMVHFPFNYYMPYALAIAVFAIGTTLVRITWRPLVWVGEISYSVYLLHPVVFTSLLWALQRTAPDSWWRTRHLGLYVLVTAASTLLLAGWTYRRVELPAIRAGRRLSQRWFGAGVRVAPHVI